MAFYNEINDGTGFVISFMPNPKQQFGAFAKGYAKAAMSLADQLVARIHFRDYEAYPVMFLYRHALELHLKNIIYKGSLIMAFRQMNDINHKLQNNHDLVELCKVATAILEIVLPNDPYLKQLTNKLETIIVEFSEIDPSSFGYRYPIDKKGYASTSKHLVANLQSVRQNLNPLLEDLDTLNFGLNIESDQAQDIYELLMASDFA